MWILDNIKENDQINVAQAHSYDKKGFNCIGRVLKVKKYYALIEFQQSKEWFDRINGLMVKFNENNKIIRESNDSMPVFAYLLKKERALTPSPYLR